MAPDSIAHGYHISIKVDNQIQNSMVVTMQETIELEGGPQTIHITGELNAEGGWAGHIAYRIGDDNKLWVGEDPKLGKLGFYGLFNSKGTMIEVAQFEGFKPTPVWLKFADRRMNIFSDPSFSLDQHKILQNFDQVTQIFNSLYNDQEAVDNFEQLFNRAIERIEDSAQNSRVALEKELVFINYNDGVREYYGQCEITEDEFGYQAEGSGLGLLNYNNQGFIYCSDFVKGLPNGFSFERAYASIGLGHYIDGYLEGAAIVASEDFVKVGLFEQNKFVSGVSYLRGDTVWIKSQNFINSMPNGPSIVKIDDNLLYDGEMEDGARQGSGMLHFMKFGMTVQGWFEDDDLIEVEKVHFKEGTEAVPLRSEDENEEEFGKRLKMFSATGDITQFEKLRITAGDSVYEGEVKNLKPHGKGEFFGQNDFVAKGEWSDGAYDGYFTFSGRESFMQGEVQGASFDVDVALLTPKFLYEQFLAEKGNLFENPYFRIGLNTGEIEAIRKAAPLERIKDLEELQLLASEHFKDVPDLDLRKIEAVGLIYSGDMIKPDGIPDWVIHGQGKSLDFCGEFYEGEFASNRFHGRGVLVREDGTRYEGLFENGVYVGEDQGGDNDFQNENGEDRGQIEGGDGQSSINRFDSWNVYSRLVGAHPLPFWDGSNRMLRRWVMTKLARLGKRLILK